MALVTVLAMLSKETGIMSLVIVICLIIYTRSNIRHGHVTKTMFNLLGKYILVVGYQYNDEEFLFQ